MKSIVHALFKRKIVAIASFVVLFFVIIAIFASVIAPYDPNINNYNASMQQPSFAHWLGTDNLGRDTLSRLIYGSRISLIIGILAVGVASVIGILLGLIAGYFGGVADNVIMRFVEMFLAIPQIVFALALGAVLGGGVFNLIVILGISAIPGYVRMTRAQVLSVKQSDYILAARVIGASDFRIIFQHVLHNTISPLIVMMSQTVGMTILAEAGLSFLGLGVAPPIASWGGMISDGKSFLMNLPVLAFAPGACVVFLVMSLNIFGDGLRDILDPRLRGSL